jgi:hypothetical protein
MVAHPTGDPRRTIGWTEAAFASSGMVGLSCRRSVTRNVPGHRARRCGRSITTVGCGLRFPGKGHHSQMIMGLCQNNLTICYMIAD